MDGARVPVVDVALEVVVGIGVLVGVERHGCCSHLSIKKQPLRSAGCHLHALIAMLPNVNILANVMIRAYVHLVDTVQNVRVIHLRKATSIQVYVAYI